MRAMLAAFAVIVIVAFVSDYALDRIGFSSADRTAGENVRLK